MAEYDDQEEGPTGNRLPPLDQLYDVITDDSAKQAVGDAIAHVNNHLQSAQIADANTRAGDLMVTDWHQFQQGMQSWVQNDPTALHPALDAVAPLAQSLIRSIPGYPEDRVEGDHQELTRNTQRQVALSALYGLADAHAGATADMLGDARVMGLLTDEDRHNVASYATGMAQARDRDAIGQQAVQERQVAQATDRRAQDYLIGLHDPAGGAETFMAGWNQSLFKDPSLPAGHKQILSDAYGKLRTEGDAPSSDPFTLAGMVGAIANGQSPHATDIAQSVTAGSLRVQDAVHLAGLDKQEAGALSSTLQGAREYLMGRDGEHGAAGVDAYGRFSNWLMGQYRQAGPGSLNPNSENWMLTDNPLPSFYPTGDTLLAGYQQNGPSDGFNPTARKPLGEIFGMGKVIPGTNIIDKGIPEDGEFRSGNRYATDIDPSMVRNLGRGGDKSFELNSGNTYESTDTGNTGPKVPRVDEDI